ncbi:MAG: amidohydrolase family protein, partial [Gemmatimonadetes bacterium]|nr:amidohydrolase family protein [Gemmatimonadota bacterium]
VLLAAPAPAPAQQFDLLIRGGMVLDGTGSAAFNADIGIVGDEIIAIGRLRGATAARVIDAAGMHVVPGFIDMHSHADRLFASDNIEGRRAHNLVMQGITTSVFGPDGRNPTWPMSAEMELYRTPGVATNVVPMVGHGTVRGLVMGDDYERHATDAEIAEMAALVRSAMEDGAWGLGAGPEYRPGRFSTTGELIALARAVAPYDGFYYSHQRSQSPLPLWQLPSMVDAQPLTGTDGMRETIEIGRAAGIRVVGTHIKAKGTDTWGHSTTDILMIEAARREGVDVYLDQYPYETFGGGPVDVIPDWAYAPPGTDRSGGTDSPLWRDWELMMSRPLDNLRANLSDPVLAAELQRDTEYILRLQGGADRHIVVAAPDFPGTVGRNLAEIAEEAGRTPFDQLVYFAFESAQLPPAGVRFRPVAGHRFDVENYMRQEYTATSTDGFVSLQTRPGQHPRSYGAFVRKISHYVKERGVITLPFAVRSSTGLPAQIIGLRDRGILREGYKADLVVFDYDELSAPATIMEPDRYPTGIVHVIVNGQFTVDDGRLTGALPGVVLDRRQIDAKTRGVSE